MRSLVLVLCVATSLVAIAQDEKKCPPRETYKSLRYDEDWSALRDPDCRIEAIDDLKFISLWGDAYMSLGGEARLRTATYYSDLGDQIQIIECVEDLCKSKELGWRTFFP